MGGSPPALIFWWWFGGGLVVVCPLSVAKSRHTNDKSKETGQNRAKIGRFPLVLRTRN